jgi:hypothetical protein
MLRASDASRAGLDRRACGTPLLNLRRLQEQTGSYFVVAPVRVPNMLKRLALLVALLALSLGAQNAAALERKPIDNRLRAASISVGAASTAGYLALNDWHLNGWHGTVISSGGRVRADYGRLRGGVANGGHRTARRPLKFREAHILFGSCLIPIIGGWLVNEAYNQHIFTAPDEEPVASPSPVRSEPSPVKRAAR